MTFDVWPHVLQVHEGLAPNFGWAVEDPGSVCQCTLDDYASVFASREAPAGGPTLTITFEV